MDTFFWGGCITVFAGLYYNEICCFNATASLDVVSHTQILSSLPSCETGAGGGVRL